ncbi:bifunctional diguanylate cyclase/phosphodiesterase [Aidingimonas halophila]|uniref:PAS domain S-box-containing protein/diguanylate cyclase (GGDEF) domain-containing protein n=1 Tax=Aidingimonas halophila TaxID=574349 RepID=A0A1H3D137_9GAMM|nr:diguanylate cyclase [Aidingimonas halophila]GHC30700.1 hypothetical protein GCM10008094_23860 [Aidingimonas halophila]SDX60046.1 PAS domain S-box-containing protein/diguanylate cyclase (GGDEF) domain-containing protein [Aidingimonas halophila]
MIQIDDGSLAASLRLASSHDHILVLLSLLVAVLASYSGLLLATNMSLAWSRWRAAIKGIWLTLGATVMGYGIWGMHFIGMLAFELPRPVTYNHTITLISGLPAILACVLPLYLVLAKRRALPLHLLAGLGLGAGIGTMHFTGMAGMQVAATMHYDLSLLVLSLGFAVGISMLAMTVIRAGMGRATTQQFMTLRTTLTSACIFGVAVTSLHYTAMVAVNFYSQPFTTTNDAFLDTSWLATGVSTVAVILGLITIFSVLITRRLQNSAHLLHITHRQLTRAVEAIGDGVFLVDEHGHLLMCNDAFTRITGYRVDDVSGQVPSPLASLHHDHAFYAHLWDTVKRRGEWQGEIWDRRHNGTDYPARLTLSAIPYDDDENTLHFVGTLTDISERKAAAEEMERLAFQDSLTKVANRRLLLDHLQHALHNTSRTANRGALLLLDLDHFKQLNDTYGHDKGDLLLQQMAQRLTDAVRAGDTVCRLGGDEFVVLLENLGETLSLAISQAEQVGHKIIDTLLPTYDLDGLAYNITTSMGITIFSGEHECCDELLKQADLALYQSKEGGRNRLHFFDPDMQAAITRRHVMEQELDQALREQQFQLRFRPQFDNDGTWHAVAAFCYWNHPRRGLLAPSEFLGDIDKQEFQLTLSEWVLETACRQAHDWSHDPETAWLPIVVDIHATHLQQSGFVDDIKERLGPLLPSPSPLIIQVSERLVQQRTKQTLEILHRLAQAGIRISLSEFGQYGLPFSTLLELPIHQLSVNTDDDASYRTQLALTMARRLRYPLIANGVARQSCHSALVEQGFRYFQGSLISDPLLPMHLLEMITKDVKVS